MNCPAAASRHIPTPVLSRADRWIGRAAGMTVGGLAGIAGAISYSHMRQLAQAHGDPGSHAHAFPLSVDGVEIVASLVLLADRRACRRSGWLPWAALAVGTTASLAANVATADAGIISRIIAGCSAGALLIAVKLLVGILEHRDTADRPAAAVPEHPAVGADGDGADELPSPLPRQAVPVPSRSARPARPASRRTARHPLDPDAAASASTTAHIDRQQASSPERMRAVPTAQPAPPGCAGTAQPAHASTWPGTVPDVADDIATLLSAARAAKDGLQLDGHPVTRDALASRLRQNGHPVRNARLTPLLQSLRSESASPSSSRALQQTDRHLRAPQPASSAARQVHGPGS